jgi:hypothetical protein
VLILASAVLPIWWLLRQYLLKGLPAIPIYAFYVYLLVLNTILLMMFSRLVASSISYPFSNGIFRRQMRRSNNRRFGVEFRRSIERMTELIQSVMAN